MYPWAQTTDKKKNKKKRKVVMKCIVIERTERESGMRMAWGPKPKADDGLVPGKPGRTAFQAEGR